MLTDVVIFCILLLFNICRRVSTSTECFIFFQIMTYGFPVMECKVIFSFTTIFNQFMTVKCTVSNTGWALLWKPNVHVKPFFYSFSNKMRKKSTEIFHLFNYVICSFSLMICMDMEMRNNIFSFENLWCILGQHVLNYTHVYLAVTAHLLTVNMVPMYHSSCLLAAE